MLPQTRAKFLLLVICSLIVGHLMVAYFWALHASKIAERQYDSTNPQKLALTREQITALLKIEDPSFWTNKGIDIHSPGQGKTTLTQSVVPLLLFSAQFGDITSFLQSIYIAIWSKFKKIDIGRDVMALAVSNKIAKEKILGIFVERVYFGSIDNQNITGFSQAASTYFKKPLTEISIEEFAGLVGMLKSPDHFHPIKNPNAYRERTKKILKVINGQCTPIGLFDTDYTTCK